jgi:hypothetical protein
MRFIICIERQIYRGGWGDRLLIKSASLNILLHYVGSLVEIFEPIRIKEPQKAVAAVLSGISLIERQRVRATVECGQERLGVAK